MRDSRESVTVGGVTVSIFERLAYEQPMVLLSLASLGLLVIDDHLPGGTARLMRHAAYRRVNRRIRQVRVA
jgi:hypothetical protein